MKIPSKGLKLKKFRIRKPRAHGKRQKGNDRRKRCAAKKSNTSLNGLSTKLWEHDRHAMLLFLSSLPLSDLLEYVVMLMTLMLVINAYLLNFLNRVIGIIS